MAEQNYENWWNTKVLETPQTDTSSAISPVNMARALGRGLYEPVEQGGLLIDKTLALTGVPYFEKEAVEQEERIKRREQEYIAAQGIHDYSGLKLLGNLFSPVPVAAALRAGRLASGPAKKALIEGGVSGLFAPSDSENYWGDKGTQAMYGSAFGLGARGVGGVMNPDLQPHARQLIEKGVPLPAHMGTVGHTQDIMHGAKTVQDLMGFGGAKDVDLNVAFNNALANDILKPLNLSTSGKQGHDLVKDTVKQISSFYDDAYVKLGTALPDQPFIASINLAKSNAAKTMDKATYDKFVQMVNNDVIGRFDIPTKTQGKAISGESLKDMRSYFQDTLKKVRESKDSDRIDNVKLSKALKEVKDTIFDYTDRVDQTGLVKRANTAWAEKNVFENAASRKPTTGIFDIQDLEASVSSSSAQETLAKGKGKLQEKAIPYLSVMNVEKTSPYVMAKRAGVLGTIAAGSAYAMWQNPVVGVAILTAAGVAPKLVQSMMKNPSQARKAIASAVKKLGPSAVANITQQVAQQDAASAREQIREINIPEYINQE